MESIGTGWFKMFFKYFYKILFKWYEEVGTLPALHLAWIGSSQPTIILHYLIGDSISEILQRILVLILILVSLADHYKKKRIKIFLLFLAIALSVIIITLQILGY